MNKKRFLLIAALVTISIVVAILFTHKKPKKHKPQETIFVSTSPVEQRDATVFATAVGNVEAEESVAVKSQVDGQLLQINFKDGDFVTAGKILFTIDPKPFTLKLQAAEAALARDQAQLNFANVTLERNGKLVSQGYIAKQDFDQLKANSAQLAATVKSDQAEVEAAKLQLSYCAIHAPINGRTGSSSISVGNLVRAGDTDPLVTINQIDPIEIKFSLPEKQFAILKENIKQGTITVQAYLSESEKNLKAGTLIFLDNTVDRQTGMITLKATFPNKDQYFWPGQFAKIKFPLIFLPKALLIPTRAVQIGQEGTYVYVVNAENKANIRPVALGSEINEETVITKGLQAGESVVTEGQMRLFDGALISQEMKSMKE